MQRMWGFARPENRTEQLSVVGVYPTLPRDLRSLMSGQSVGLMIEPPFCQVTVGRPMGGCHNHWSFVWEGCYVFLLHIFLRFKLKYDYARVTQWSSVGLMIEPPFFKWQSEGQWESVNHWSFVWEGCYEFLLHIFLRFKLKYDMCMGMYDSYVR